MKKPLLSPQEFTGFVATYKQSGNYRDPVLFAVGGAVRTQNDMLASVRYPVVNGLGENTGIAAIIMSVLRIVPDGVQTVWLTKSQLQEILSCLAVFENDGNNYPNIEVLKKALKLYEHKGPDAPGDAVVSFIFENGAKVVGVEDATLRLYGRSLGLYVAHDQGITDILRVLPSVIWENDVPLDPDVVTARLLQAAFEGKSFAPSSVSKIPLLMHRINPAQLKRVSPELASARLGTFVDSGGNVRLFP